MYAHHDGVKLFYQTTGGSGPELFLHPPSQPVVYSRAWKYQLAYLSRYFRVTVLDPRGNRRSHPPLGPAAGWLRPRHALPRPPRRAGRRGAPPLRVRGPRLLRDARVPVRRRAPGPALPTDPRLDRKSTRLNSSHG